MARASPGPGAGPPGPRWSRARRPARQDGARPPRDGRRSQEAGSPGRARSGARLGRRRWPRPEAPGRGAGWPGRTRRRPGPGPAGQVDDHHRGRVHVGVAGRRPGQGGSRADRALVGGPPGSGFGDQSTPSCSSTTTRRAPRARSPAAVSTMTEPGRPTSRLAQSRGREQPDRLQQGRHPLVELVVAGDRGGDRQLGHVLPRPPPKQAGGRADGGSMGSACSACGPANLVVRRRGR